MKIRRNIAISDSGFIFNPDTGESFSTNALAVEIFNQLKEEKSFDEISEKIMKNYHVEQATFEKDYHDFMGFLEQYNLLENEQA
ncbi:MAG: PqqD family protein [Bacteroidota bacterium]|nr:PqqD family protein [Bacteroidota bacterium]